MPRYEQVQRTPAQERANEVEDRADNYMDILVKRLCDLKPVDPDESIYEALTCEAFALAEAFQAEVDRRRDEANAEENQS